MELHTLPTGLRVLIDSSRDQASSAASSVVAAQVWVEVGSADEQPEDAGLAHVHEHMLFKGTATRGVGEVAAAVEGAGGEINAYTSFDQTVYHVTMPSSETELAIDVLADVVQNSAFDPDELSRELEVVLEELRRGQDNPGRVTSELLFGEVFKTHTYGRPIIGYVDTVQNFTRDQILRFYRSWYRPSNMVLVVSGDVDSSQVLKLAGDKFQFERDGRLPERPRSSEPSQLELRYADRGMDVQETQLQMAWPGPKLTDDITPVIDVLSVLLGTGESSRLYRRVRRDQQAVTDCYAFSYTPKDGGLLGIGAQLQSQPVSAAFQALLREAYLLRRQAPTVAEVEKAKTIILSEAVYGMQTVQGRARKLGYFEMLGGGVSFEEKYRRAVESVTPAKVLEAAQAWLRSDALSVSMVFPQGSVPGFGEEEAQRIVAEVERELAATPIEADAVASPERILPRSIATAPMPNTESVALGVTQATLSNGATVLVQPDSTVPMVSIMAASKGGLLAEEPLEAGVSHLVSELIVRGTERYSAEVITETCDAMAAGLGGQSGRNSSGLRGEFLKGSWDQGLELFISCLLEPSFPEEEFERERRYALEDLAARADSPTAVAFDELASALFGEHPYSCSVLGNQESVSGMTRDAVVAAYRRQLRPDNLTLTVVGDVAPEQVIQRLEGTVGQASAHPSATDWAEPPVPRALERTVEEWVERDKAQVQLMLGFMGLTMHDPRRFALELMCQVLGGQSGRLFLELRDRQSLAYSVGASNLEGLAPGYLLLHIGTHPDKLETAERGMRAELDRMKNDLVSEEELERARRYLSGSYQIGLQRRAARSGAMTLNHIYGLGHDAHARYPEQLTSVTPQQIRDVAQDLADFDRVVRVVVGPKVVG